MFGLFERRKHQRFPVDIPVDLDATGHSHTIHTKIIQVSVEGLQMETQEPFEVGQMAKVAFEVPGEGWRKPQPVTIEGHVVHAKRRDERFFEVGINIEKVDEVGQEAYARYLVALGAK